MLPRSTRARWAAFGALLTVAAATALGLATAGTASAGPTEGTVAAAFNPQSSNPGDPVDLTVTLTGKKGGFEENQEQAGIAYDSHVLSFVSAAPVGNDCSHDVGVSDPANPGQDGHYGCYGLPAGHDPLTITYHFRVMSSAKPGTTTKVQAEAQYGKVNGSAEASLSIVAPPGVKKCPPGDATIQTNNGPFCAPNPITQVIDDVKRTAGFRHMSAKQQNAFLKDLDTQLVKAYLTDGSKALQFLDELVTTFLDNEGRAG